jgi:hypothetical protein
MLLAIAATIPLMELLLTLPFFAHVAKPLPSREGILPKKSWRKNAAITLFLAGVGIGGGLFKIVFLVGTVFVTAVTVLSGFNYLAKNRSILSVK